MGPAAIAVVTPIVFGGGFFIAQAVSKKNLQHDAIIDKEKQIKILTRDITQQFTKSLDIIMLEVYLIILEQNKDLVNNIKSLDLVDLKQKYRNLIEKLRLSQQSRKYINLAYEFINRKYYGIQYSQEEQSLVNAIFEEDLNKLDQILKKNPQLINFRQKGSNYPLLYLAVRTGCYQLVEFILNKNVSLQFSGDRSTPMHCAAFYGHYQIIGLLVHHGIPLNIKNFFNHLPIEEAKSQKIKTLIRNSQNDNIYDLITKLAKQHQFLTSLTIKHKQKQVARKIVLKIYKDSDFASYDDAFHGTKFYNFFSIVKHGLRKAGDIAGDQIITVPYGHIQNRKWAERIFSSPSIFYSACSAYSPEIEFFNTKNDSTETWLPVVQVKIKKNSYTTQKSTTSTKCHIARPGQPTQIQYISEYVTEKERSERVIVVALIFVKKSFLCKQMDYQEVTNTILRSSEEMEWKTHWMKYKK